MSDHAVQMWHEGGFNSTNDHENPRSNIIYTQEPVRDGNDGYETNSVDTVGLVANVAIRQVSCSTTYRKSLSVVLYRHLGAGVLFTTTRCILDSDPTVYLPTCGFCGRLTFVASVAICFYYTFI